MSLDLLTLFQPIAYWTFLALLFIFGVHTLVLSYHWFNYGTEREISIAALAIYLLGGAVIFGGMAVVITLL